MKLFNHTPHAVDIYKDGRLFCSFPPSAPVIRLVDDGLLEQTTEEFDGITVISPPNYVETNYTPPFRTRVIVSAMVAEFLVARPALAEQFYGIYAPDTSPSGAVRNGQGQIIGTTRLVKYK